MCSQEPTVRGQLFRVSAGQESGPDDGERTPSPSIIEPDRRIRITASIQRFRVEQKFLFDNIFDGPRIRQTDTRNGYVPPSPWHRTKITIAVWG